jgi:hypothetical protein
MKKLLFVTLTLISFTSFANQTVEFKATGDEAKKMFELLPKSSQFFSRVKWGIDEFHRTNKEVRCIKTRTYEMMYGHYDEDYYKDTYSCSARIFIDYNGFTNILRSNK